MREPATEREDARRMLSAETALDRLLQARSRTDPDSVAVVDPAGGHHLTYRELDRRAGQAARFLRRRGVAPEDRVGLLMERSIDLILAILGILKAGGAYVPLDPASPPARSRGILDDARVAILVAHEHLLDDSLAEGIAVVRLATDRLTPDREAMHRQTASDPGLTISPDGGAYVLYTSGSTGKPKGVEITRRSLIHYALAAIEHYAIVPEDRILQFSSISFDISVEEIFPCLTVGGTLVLREPTMVESVAEFYRRCGDWSITGLFLPTAFWHELATAARAAPALISPTLRVVCFGGEQVQTQRIADWRAAVVQGESAAIRLLNSYGPTETTVVATLHQLMPQAGPSPDASIGRPIRSVHAQVHDDRLRASAPGAAGELCLGGEGVARGYLGRPGATAASFVPDPLSDRPGLRLYRTGDRVRRLPGGDFEFLGRFDLQVKLHGFRVEPGEIESALATHPAVASAVVVVREPSSQAAGDRQLVAYLVAESDGAGRGDPGRGEAERGVDARQLRQFLSGKLPAYMIPAAFVWIDALPLTSRGKLDRKALTLRSLPVGLLEESYVAPRGPIEEKLAAIWAAVLRLPRIGIHDNFFERGGDSILGIQIAARASREGLRLIPQDLFRYQTVARLAAVSERVALSDPDHDAAPAAATPSGPVELTPIQRWLFFEADPPELWHYNQSMWLQVRKPLEPWMLECAVRHLLSHHDALRMRFVKHGGRWRQRQAGAERESPLHWIDLSSLRPADHPRIIERATAQLQTTLNLERGPILRVAFFDLGGQSRLFLAIHHLVVDTVSWQILLADLESACRQLRAGRRVDLPPKTTSYQEWARRLKIHTKSAALRQKVDFWLRLPKRERRLPVDMEAKPGGNTRGSAERVTVTLNRQHTRALLRRLPAVFRTRINDALLTALTLAFARWTGNRSLLVEIESHGRHEILEGVNLSRTMGWFTSTFPVRLDLAGTHGPGEALKAIKEQLRAVPRFGADYYLARHMNDDPELSRELRAMPQPELSFNYHGQLDAFFPEASMLAIADETIGRRRSPRGPRGYVFEIESYVTDERLHVHLGYSRDLHHRSSVETLARQLEQELEGLIAHCLSPGAGGYTPSDFPLAGLDANALDRLLGTRRGIEDIYPLSPMQEGMLFHTLYAPERAVYFEQSSWELDGDIEISTFHDAWRRIVERHSILRTSFAWKGLERPLQIVHRQVELPWREHDWRRLDPAAQQERLEALLARDRHRGFELSQAPLMRLILVRLGERSLRFVWSAHHVLLDGWSISVIFEELFTLYRGLRDGLPTALERPLPFRDYVAWLERQDGAGAEAFWNRNLAEFSTPTPLAIADRAAALSETPVASDFEDLFELLSRRLTDRLEAFGKRHRLTLNSLVQGAWALLLARYSGHDDVVFGATVSGRSTSLPNSESLVGLLINTLPVRVRVQDKRALLPWLRRLQDHNLELRQFEHTPLVKAQTWSAVPRHLPLFETLLVYENYPVEAALERDQQRDGLTISHFLGYSETNYPLALGVLPGGELGLHASYDGNRFDAVSIQRLLRHLKALLRGMAAAEAATADLASLPILTPGERHQILTEWNDTGGQSLAVSFEDRFETRARQTPDAVAVVDPGRGQTITYRRLNRQANRLAAALTRRGLKTEDRVALLLPRSLDQIVAILAVLKAGGAYVALDADYPRRRLEWMLADSRVAMTLFDSRHASFSPDGGSRIDGATPSQTIGPRRHVLSPGR